MEIEKLIKEYMVQQESQLFSYTTIANYKSIILAYLRHFKEKSRPEDITFEEFINYFNQWEALNTRAAKINGVKSFYNLMGINTLDLKQLDKPRRKKKDVTSWDKKVLIDKIDDIDNRKHKALMTMAYSTGMRLGEILDLELKDIDFENNIIIVRQVATKRIRRLPLSEGTKDVLLRYIKKFTPTKYLFNGHINPKYSGKSALCVVKKYLGQDCNFHIIRNSNAVALLNAGVSVKNVQKQLGHADKKTTKVFEKNYKEIKVKAVLPI